ncbi:MAG TPA: NFACT RNA binding domain-containing protein [Candidatus Eisenbacteria bacterium]|nr:NFACT RNA binding domain-containing protein [Candidatus Eisenbacteria bacterium]
MNAIPDENRRDALVRALEKHRRRLERKLEAVHGDLAESRRAPEYRRWGETLLAYLRQVPARAERVKLPDPADPDARIEIPLDADVTPQVNAARYFRRAAKGERGQQEIPPRLAKLQTELRGLRALLARAAALDAASEGEAVPAIDAELEAAVAALPETVRRAVGAPRPPRTAARTTAGGSGAATGAAEAAAAPEPRAPSARLQPRRLKTREGWDVLIGRNNDGNDYLTLHLARPEDYWFHVHGASGSHVVLRRGKGRNEPSKQTIEEVAAWAAFYSQARTAGKVPVIVTRKKYVRKPRKAPAGTVVCEREKTVMVRPQEPAS